MTNPRDFYAGVLMDHHREPRRAELLPAPTHRGELSNPLCGDRAVVTLDVRDGRLIDARCQVLGCAICRAAGSVMAESVSALGLAEVRRRMAEFCRVVGARPVDGGVPSSVEAEAEEPECSSSAGAGPAEFRAFADVRRFPNRLRCATLPWEALGVALREAR